MSDFVVTPGRTLTFSDLGNLQVTNSSSTQNIQISQPSPPNGVVTITGNTSGVNIATSATTILPYVVRTGAASDNITVGAAADTVVSGAGNDIINTRGGNDTVDAGAGRNTVSLGAGADTIIVGADVRPLTRNTLTLVTDFNSADDTINLSKSLLKGAGFKTGGLKKSSFSSVRDIRNIGVNTTPQIVYDQRTGIVFLNPVGGANRPLIDLPANQRTINQKDFRIF